MNRSRPTQHCPLSTLQVICGFRAWWRKQRPEPRRSETRFGPQCHRGARACWSGMCSTRASRSRCWTLLQFTTSFDVSKRGGGHRAWKLSQDTPGSGLRAQQCGLHSFPTFPPWLQSVAQCERDTQLSVTVRVQGTHHRRAEGEQQIHARECRGKGPSELRN